MKALRRLLAVALSLSLPLVALAQAAAAPEAAKPADPPKISITPYGIASLALYKDSGVFANQDDAKEKIELQVSQSVFKVNEAAKKLIMAEKNLEKADENLRYATLGFEEGVIPASNVLEAHTAWLSAQSEKIDAQIDVKLTEIYLKKATGSLNIEN